MTALTVVLCLGRPAHADDRAQICEHLGAMVAAIGVENVDADLFRLVERYECTAESDPIIGELLDTGGPPQLAACRSLAENRGLDTNESRLAACEEKISVVHDICGNGNEVLDCLSRAGSERESVECALTCESSTSGADGG